MKYLLLPFSLLYQWITAFRNHLYDLKIWKSVEFDVNVISVGNLAVGGTGKSPMVEYIINLLIKANHKPAILSRGYKRKTKGFRLATAKDDAGTIGDEPYQFWKKFNGSVPVAVGEERVMAIPEILFSNDELNTVVCDDAFQHRPLRPGFSILLSTYDNPFFKDHLMPMGKLREARGGAFRADAIIFTKCSDNVDLRKQEYVEQATKYSKENIPIFFTKTVYKKPKPLFDVGLPWSNKVLLVSGLANSSYIEVYVEQNFELTYHIKFKDHHSYTAKDAALIKTNYDQLCSAHNNVVILTTEKDAVKIQAIDQLSDLPVFYLPIEVEFLYEGDKFERLILDSFTDNVHSE